MTQLRDHTFLGMRLTGITIGQVRRAVRAMAVDYGCAPKGSEREDILMGLSDGIWLVCPECGASNLRKPPSASGVVMVSTRPGPRSECELRVRRICPPHPSPPTRTPHRPRSSHHPSRSASVRCCW